LLGATAAALLNQWWGWIFEAWGKSGRSSVAAGGILFVVCLAQHLAGGTLFEVCLASGYSWLVHLEAAAWAVVYALVKILLGTWLVCTALWENMLAAAVLRVCKTVCVRLFVGHTCAELHFCRSSVVCGKVFEHCFTSGWVALGCLVTLKTQHLLGQTHACHGHGSNTIGHVSALISVV
jgi:hypothetical protein